MPPPVINTPDIKQVIKTEPIPSSGIPITPSSAVAAQPSSVPRTSGTSPTKKPSDLLCRVKWNNTLPDIPFDPKFITYPFDSDRFTKYKPTSLEKDYKHDLLTEHDLGVTIDLINPETYETPRGAALSLEDERIIEDDSSMTHTPHGISEKRSRQHSKVVPWLKKTEYISTEFNRYGVSNENNETKVGYNVQKKFKEDKEKIICMDRDGQVMAINKTFEEARKAIKYHHSKPGVKAEEVLPVFPDFDFWKMPFAQVSFDAEPVTKVPNEEGKLVEDREACETIMKEAMIRGVEDPSGEQFVAYFLPTEETLAKRLRDADNEVSYENDDIYEYRQTREYTWAVKNKSSRGYDQNYFFVTRDGGVFYNELETRVKLTKRRNKNPGPAAKTKLIVRHREMTEQELKTQDLRMLQLKPNEEEEMDIGIKTEEKDNKEGAKPNEENGKNVSDEDSDEEKKAPEEEKKEKPVKRSRKSSSSSSSDSGSSSSSGSSSESEAEDEDAKAKKKVEEIFGSDDDSD